METLERTTYGVQAQTRDGGWDLWNEWPTAERWLRSPPRSSCRRMGCLGARGDLSRVWRLFVTGVAERR